MKLILGDCLDKLKGLPTSTIDAVVTDPPYGLSFMGKKWDHDVPSTDIWEEALRVLKPGGHLLSFFGTRTYHAGVKCIEDAGFEIRDMISWIYGSGLPKSLGIAKAIDKQAKAIDKQAKAKKISENRSMSGGNYERLGPHDPITGDAKRWDGWGTALKPSCEPIVVARKPLSEKTVAANVLRWGCGGLNIDGSRIGTFNDGAARSNTPGSGRMKIGGGLQGSDTFSRSNPSDPLNENQGRWPANTIFDEEAAAMLDEQTADTRAARPRGGQTVSRTFKNCMFKPGIDSIVDGSQFNDSGGASRFFYVAKSSKRERNAGMGGAINNHCTVKPLKLMEYLCRLITPPGGIILDPFMGSGTTGCAARKLGFQFIGIEKEEEYFEIAKRRIEYWEKQAAQTNLELDATP